MGDVASLASPSPSLNLVAAVVSRLSEIGVVEFLSDWQSRLDLLVWTVCAWEERTVPLVLEGEVGEIGDSGGALAGVGSDLLKYQIPVRSTRVCASGVALEVRRHCIGACWA